MRVDSHQHFWRYDPVEYGWIGPEQRVLQRDFRPADLHAELRAAGIDAAVSVQARQSLAETDWLLDLADEHPFLAGVVGWVPLEADDLSAVLDRYAARPKLVGVRHVLQDEPDDAYCLRPAFDRGIGELARRNLVYDILIFERQLPAAIALVDAHLGQRFVLDHVAKPRIRAGELEPWASLMRELARRPNVTCKLSGLVTEADHASWTPSTLRPYVEVALEAFGPARLMFGSDWPVCLLAAGYSRWAEVARGCVAELSAGERERVLGGTAVEAYGLKEP